MLPGKKFLVTGAGSGIGREVAQSLLREGSTVIATGRREGLLRSLAENDSPLLHVLPCDLSVPKEREGLVRKAAELAGGLDGLIYSAGVVSHQQPGSVDEESLRFQLEVNLVAPMRLGEEALEVLNPGGSMVFLSSTLAVRPILSSMVYSASKAGLEAAMKSLALAGAPRGIRANAVSPGLVDTEMLRGRREEGASPHPNGDQEAFPGRELEAEVPGSKGAENPGTGYLEALTSLHPLGRLGTPSDVAAAVLFLLAAPWVTGSTLVCDGGLLLRE